MRRWKSSPSLPSPIERNSADGAPSHSDCGREPRVVGEQLFLDVMRLMQHAHGDPHEGARLQRNVAVALNPHFRLTLQDVQNVVGIFMDVPWNLRPDLPADDGACHVHILILLGEQICDFYPCELRMRIPIHLGLMNYFRRNGFKYGWHLSSLMTFGTYL